MISVLIIEASPASSSALQNGCATNHAVPSACKDLVAARRLLRARTFDAILLSATLPDDAVWDFLADLRSNDRTAKVPVIVLSAECGVDERIDGMRAGAADFIGKPYRVEYVIRRLTELTQHGSDSSWSGTGPGRVLLVDDSATYGAAMLDELRTDGHDTIIAPTAKDARRVLDAQRVDAVVLDVFLPDANGVDVCRGLRALPGWENTPIIMLTGSKESVIKETAFRAGATAFVTKSADAAALRAAVRDAFHRARSRTRRDKPGPEAASTATGLFERVVTASGMSSVLGRAGIERACLRAGVNPTAMSVDDLAHALPEIERVLCFFLSASDAHERVQAISRLVQNEKS